MHFIIIKKKMRRDKVLTRSYMIWPLPISNFISDFSPLAHCILATLAFCLPLNTPNSFLPCGLLHWSSIDGSSCHSKYNLYLTSSKSLPQHTLYHWILILHITAITTLFLSYKCKLQESRHCCLSYPRVFPRRLNSPWHTARINIEKE